MIEVTVERLLPMNRVLASTSEGRRVHGFNEKALPLEVGEVVLFSEDRKIIKCVTYKLDIWGRSTETETEQLLEALESQPKKLQMIFKDAQYISRSDEDYELLQSNFVTLFGEDRTEELLAVSV